jgi:hypothetical protein
MKKGAQQTVKHKPNTRHTLNEVLHSLQDMMHNELADIDLPVDPDVDKSRSKEEALNNLRALIGIQPVTAQPITAVDPSPGNSGADTGPRSDEIKDIELSNDRDALDNLPDIDLDDIELEDFAEEIETGPEIDPAANEASSVDDFALEMEDANEPAAAPVARKADKTPSDPKPEKRKNTSSKSAEQVEIHWDDIPVLNDVVAPPPTPDDATSRQAREIAIKVAAALNIELKKDGTGEMDIKTIMRLQSLLGRELAEHSGGTEPEPPENNSEPDHEGTDPDARDDDA